MKNKALLPAFLLTLGLSTITHAEPELFAAERAIWVYHGKDFTIIKDDEGKVTCKATQQ